MYYQGTGDLIAKIRASTDASTATKVLVEIEVFGEDFYGSPISESWEQEFFVSASTPTVHTIEEPFNPTETTMWNSGVRMHLRIARHTGAPRTVTIYPADCEADPDLPTYLLVPYTETPLFSLR